jgi:hypothetical protein
VRPLAGELAAAGAAVVVVASRALRGLADAKDPKITAKLAIFANEGMFEFRFEENVVDSQRYYRQWFFLRKECLVSFRFVVLKRVKNQKTML